MRQRWARTALCGSAVAALLVGGLATSATAEDAAPGGDYTVPAIDPQNWENQQDMTWDDWTDIPGTSWNDPSAKPAKTALNIALVAVDFPDQKFVITQPKGSDSAIPR